MEPEKSNTEGHAGRGQLARVVWLALAALLAGVASDFLTLPYHQWRASWLFIGAAACLVCAWKLPPLFPRR